MSATHYCFALAFLLCDQEVDMEFSQSKLGNFLSQNTLFGEFLAGGSFIDITWIRPKLSKISLMNNTLRL